MDKEVEIISIIEEKIKQVLYLNIFINMVKNL